VPDVPAAPSEVILAPWNSSLRRRSKATRKASFVSPVASAIPHTPDRLYVAYFSSRIAVGRQLRSRLNGKSGVKDAHPLPIAISSCPTVRDEGRGRRAPLRSIPHGANGTWEAFPHHRPYFPSVSLQPRGAELGATGELIRMTKSAIVTRSWRLDAVMGLSRSVSGGRLSLRVMM
jgi:hypothetical protein